MLSLTMTRGLPGSGKSTWASQQDAIVVNKDDIRKSLTAKGWVWSHENEKDVIACRDAAILGTLRSGRNVISSDTNFGRHESHLRQLAQQCDAEFIIKDFTNVPVNVCIERDARRSEGRVGREVIIRMAEQNGLLPEQQKYEPVAGTPFAIICDLDGTVALKGDRSPFDYNKVDKDKVNTPIASIVKAFAELGYTIIYCSGREDWCRDKTDDWLRTNGLPKGPLFMRPSGDHRKDSIVKQEIFDAKIRPHYNVRFVLDDRDQVVKMWRGLGLTCLQVAEGSF